MMSWYLHLFHIVVSSVEVIVGDISYLGVFGVQAGDCSNETCPGSCYNLVTAAWANIAYMTHADFLHLVNDTSFSAWAPLLYVAGAIGALFGVALNSPPRNWTWFLLGPAIFNFLVFTTVDVKGVAWKVAGEMMPMNDVWKDAETGLGNTILVDRLGIQVNRDSGPSGQYPVAWGMVFFDKLFSASADALISWTGIGRQMGDGGADSNLAAKAGNGLGPWYILANLKWSMLENIVGVSARDPDVRDALVTFLASECGDKFKKGVDTGNYIAASQSHGASLPGSVLKSTNNSIDLNWLGLGTLNWTSYQDFVRGMDTEVIPTPRSIVRLYNQDPQHQGAFTQFSQKFNTDERFSSGRTTEIVCSEYLYTVIQALRWESGHAFWQLVRSSPNGFTREQLLKSLFYGWDVRKAPQDNWASQEQLEDFVKNLIFVYMLRNELLYAPQLTEIPQRFAPSEQARNFSQAYVGTQGSRSKAAELYNWAVMMPHVQGILVYLVLIFYPFAAMMMVIPGYWKTFFTWISFFAWVKLWDVGFAIVHTLERSVWAMIGNHSSMARVANMLIQTAENTGQITVGTASGCSGDKLSELCAVPDVKESQTLTMQTAWGLFDKILLLTGSADLDVSNGYYIYIMSALYFAVPAVAGQLVLGAKAGMASMATQAIQGSAGEAGTATKQATVGEAVNKLATNQGSIGQAAMAKAHRQSGLALQQFESQNAALDSDLFATQVGATKGALGAAADAADKRSKSFASQVALGKAMAGGVGSLQGAAKEGTGSGTGGLPSKVAGAVANNLPRAGHLLNIGAQAAQTQLDQNALSAGARSSIYGANADWNAGRARMQSAGFNNYAARLGSEAQFNAESAAWEAKNEFATHMAGMGGVSGMNPGSLAPGPKPTDSQGMAMSGQLGGLAQGSARYSGAGFLQSVNTTMGAGRAAWGSGFVSQHWGGGFESLGSAVSHAASSDTKAVRDAAQKALKSFEE